MHVSSQMLEHDALKEAKDKADGRGPRIGLSPAALKRKAIAKKKAAREAAKAGA